MDTKKLVAAQQVLAKAIEDRRPNFGEALAQAVTMHEAAVGAFEQDLTRELQADLARAAEIISTACLKAAAAQEALGGIKALAVLDELCVPNVDMSIRGAKGPHLIVGWASMGGERSIVFRRDWKTHTELVALADQLASSKRLRNDANDELDRIKRVAPRTDVA